MRVPIQSIAAALVVAGAIPAEASSLYWSLFNVEGENSQTAQYVTYGALADMLGDTNRLGVFNPGGGGVGRNIVGSGAAPAAPAVIPLPAGGWLLAVGCLCLAGLRRRWAG